jgi:hypothetical protein
MYLQNVTVVAAETAGESATDFRAGGGGTVFWMHILLGLCKTSLFIYFHLTWWVPCCVSKINFSQIKLRHDV